MARYEATGDEALRIAAENFFEELHEQHTFVTGGSTAGEIWMRAGELGGPVATQRKDNYWAHDHAETCVACARLPPHESAPRQRSDSA